MSGWIFGLFASYFAPNGGFGGSFFYFLGLCRYFALFSARSHHFVLRLSVNTAQYLAFLRVDLAVWCVMSGDQWKIEKFGQSFRWAKSRVSKPFVWGGRANRNVVRFGMLFAIFPY